MFITGHGDLCGMWMHIITQHGSRKRYHGCPYALPSSPLESLGTHFTVGLVGPNLDTKKWKINHLSAARNRTRAVESVV